MTRVTEEVSIWRAKSILQEGGMIVVYRPSLFSSRVYWRVLRFLWKTRKEGVYVSSLKRSVKQERYSDLCVEVDMEDTKRILWVKGFIFLCVKEE